MHAIGKIKRLRIHYTEKDQIVLEVDPRLATPTGTHPTTTLCIDLMKRYMGKGDSVLDVGTGSGILAIVAAKLGAMKVLGIDKNPIAVEIARKNVLLNGIEEKRFRVKAGNLLHGIEGMFDLVVANILPEIIFFTAE